MVYKGGVEVNKVGAEINKRGRDFYSEALRLTKEG
jgi:hypothetical protein